MAASIAPAFQDEVRYGEFILNAGRLLFPRRLDPFAAELRVPVNVAFGRAVHPREVDPRGQRQGVLKKPRAADDEDLQDATRRAPALQPA